MITLLNQLIQGAMNPKIGEKIKNIFDAKEMKLKDFAEEIGLARQNVYRIFGKDSIDTELLTKISSVLEHDFFQYYKSKESERKASDELVASNKSNVDIQNELEFYINELRLAKKEIDYLKKIIELMEERTKLLLSQK
jgi:transcriptional regulator with XRE-family HTH domain